MAQRPRAWVGSATSGLARRREEAAGKVGVETRCSISSLSGGAWEFSGAVRGLWGIEDRQHRVLDIVFREDESRVRVGHAAENFRGLRWQVLHLLRQDTSACTGIKARRLRAGWDEDYLCRLHPLTFDSIARYCARFSSSPGLPSWYT